MGKPGLGLFTARRKSQGNVFDELDISTSPDTTAPPADSGGFRLLSRTEVEKAKEQRKTQEKDRSSKFPRFSGFGHPGKQNRNQPFDDDSPASSNRDSKSSSGTQFSNSRPYANGKHGSTSTLPSSTDTSSDDNVFANVPRPTVTQHNSSPAAPPSVKAIRKQLPSLPKSSTGVSSYKDLSGSGWTGRSRAMTTSSYASTAVPPKLEGDLNFGGFEDDMFSHLNRNESHEIPREPVGRSLLAEKRTFQAEPIKIKSQFDVEPPLKSWDSRNSTDNLMASPHSDNDSPPPPPPPPHHRYPSYAPVASQSPTLQDTDAQFVRKSFMEKKSYHQGSTEPKPNSMSSPPANSYETPYSSRSVTTSSSNINTTPKAAAAPTPSSYNDNDNDEDEDDLFITVKSTPKPAPTPARKSATFPSQNKSTSAPVSDGGHRVMSQAEFREYQKKRASQLPPEESSEDEDYDDEEDAIKRREEEELMRRKNQQMQFAREAMRRSTTATGLSTEPEAEAMGFPSETSMKAGEWEDEDVPLGILAQHGFPSQTRNRHPSQPTNAIPSYIPDRPASVGAMSQRASTMNLPAFARNLPQDPYNSSFIGGGLVRPTNRESMGFNGFAQSPGSVAGDSAAGMGMNPAMMYQDAGMSQPSLVDQIQMRDMTKQKYMGGASAKKPQGGPFTGMLGQQMNTNGQPQHPTRMSQMPMTNGMNPMNPMMGGQMPMGQMGMGMGMGQTGYPMSPGDYMQQMQQMQQMIAMQQMQLQMMQQQPQQQDPRMSMADPRMSMADPRMSMAMPNNGYAGSIMGGGGGGGNFLNVTNGQNRPMSMMSFNGGQQQQQRSMSFMGPPPGYTPSIAPSERSNIGLSARYRPVVNQSDAVSNGTSMTLQATGGTNPNRGGVIKGILKKGSPGPQINVAEPDDAEEDWGQMAARKNKSRGKENNSSDLEDLTRGLNI